MNQDKYPRFSPDDEDEFTEKLVKILRNSRIESLTIIDEFEDDGCLCFNIEMIIDDQNYCFSLWWESKSTMKLLYQAEVSQLCRNNFAEFLLERYENF